MRRLLDSDLELLVESGFIYLPLLLDPDIEQETRKLFRSKRSREGSGRSGSEAIIRHKDGLFIKTLSIRSLLQHHKTLDPYAYNRLKNASLQKYQLTSGVDDIFLDETLELILFQIMPYFIKGRRGLQRKKLSEEEILDLISERIDIPEKYYSEALRFIDLKPLTDIQGDLEDQKPIHKSPANGLWPARKLRDWFHGAIQAKILADERDRVKKTLQVRQQLAHTKPEHVAIFFYIADKGSIEIEGFGFSRMKSHKEYLIYKRTGEYVLKDYYGRSYLFPDCRVAVSTYYTPLKPLVIEKYKHPFLRGYQAGQEICMGGFEAPTELTAEAVIQVLEEGITALLHSYDARRRIGYHSLDKTFVHIPTIVFEDYRV